ncbi:MAG: hypothetical protein ABIK36_03685 [Pseudomonadota bacterium]
MNSMLTAKGYPSAERRFLMAGAASELAPLGQLKLIKRVEKCGIDWARAHILSCTHNSVEFLWRHIKSPEKVAKNISEWGKNSINSREAVFIGGFFSCYAAARKELFR